MTVTNVELTISSDFASVGRARCLALCVAEVLDIHVDRDVLALLTTELVTNAVRLDAGEVTVRFGPAADGGIRVAVHDQGRGTPRLTRPDPLEPSGRRGLMIVDLLAAEWGVERTEEDKAVWFRLAGLATEAPPAAADRAHRDDHHPGDRQERYHPGGSGARGTNTSDASLHSPGDGPGAALDSARRAATNRAGSARRRGMEDSRRG